MANKLWYTPLFEGECVDESIHFRNDIQQIIDMYCPELFQAPEDITPDNLQQFLEIILINYQYYYIRRHHILNLGEAFDDYFERAYKENFLEAGYIKYPDTDRHQLVLYIWHLFLSSGDFSILLPEYIPLLPECLHTSDDQIIYMYDKIDKYFEQFDIKAHTEEIYHRHDILSEQRLKALEKGDPLPIRPMGIKLDMCYKNG